MFFYLLIAFITGFIIGASFMYCDRLEKANEKLEKENNAMREYIRNHQNDHD